MLSSTLPALRFLTAGQVDDGKSTLIGRLLYDTNALKEDRLEHLKNTTTQQQLNFASLSDGLLDEDARHITIDVAHHYLRTPERTFVLLDAPGHEEYTCNMVTAASTCHAAVILVDASRVQHELTDLPIQTKRHTLLAHLLGIPSVIFAINKLDLVDDPALTFKHLQTLLKKLCHELKISPTGIVPISALLGINIVHALTKSNHALAQQLLTVYEGPSLLGLLSRLSASFSEEKSPLHLPIQYANAHASWGRLASGKIQLGDEVTLQPLGIKAHVSDLFANALIPPQTLEEAQAGQSVGVRLKTKSEIVKPKRGEWIEHSNILNSPTQSIKATLIWFDRAPRNAQQTYLLKHQHTWVNANITQVLNQVDPNDLQIKPTGEIKTNTIAQVFITLSAPLPMCPYTFSRTQGAFILVNPHTHQTSAAGLVLENMLER